MSKKQNGKIKVFFAEIDGDNETIQQGLETVASTISKTFDSSPRTIKVIASSEMPTEQIKSIEAVEIVEEEAENIEKSEKLKRQPSSYKAPTQSFVKDLNLRPSNQSSFRDFFESKNNSSQAEAITIAVYYLEKILEVSEISADHVYTCFKNVSYRIPKKLPQSIRDTASKKGWIDTNAGKITVTHHGENLVEYDLNT